MSKLLLIGSVHLDIVGDFEEKVQGHIDKEGALKFSVGGAAYNIAANLAYKNHSVALFTYLKKQSLSTDVIKKALKAANIKTMYITEDCNLSESGYISHSLSGTLYSAVSSMAIQEKAFDENERSKIDVAVKKHDLIVLDTNLNVRQIETVVEISEKFNKPIFICNVSDSKCHRVLEISKGIKKDRFKFLSLNEKELSTVFEDTENLTPTTVCDKFLSETVLVTHGRKGFSVYSRLEDKIYQAKACYVASIKSEIGAGDAFFAAVVSHHVKNGKINWKECEQTINEYVGRVLKTDGATPEGANILFQKNETRENVQSIIAFSTAMFAFVLTAIGFFVIESKNCYATFFFVIPVLSGIAGSFVRHLLGKGADISDNVFSNISLGGIAGCLVALTFFLSHWSTLGSSIVQMITTSEVQPNMRPILGFLFVSAFVAGLAVEVAFDKTAKKDLDKMIEK